MAFGEAAFGEAAFGQGVGAIVAGGAVDGVMHIIETPDVFSMVGSVPVISISAVADPNMLVIVIELELGVLN